ncbi:hypothetical protein I302_108881 [Kwoniella bestiolae CBS 10118]|uniref:Zn(2)-C6 fungal-type domain-containing protein n=1 Tax=Kwoniella bestiolae CBS 10118 TaxID=1296100 RepID=A0A1B9FUC8_9TREE|nr:hypothetical protein I302_08018 [Kwoniella bestiolae CBS 10118]OCF22371.1 hypothetical protein I302_08018 [Kwoniella bestiolae CBS 10118]
MPKDEPSHPPPLKRGDACLYCRKRRIRCSADKPTCQHCLKSGRECVYDTGKPVSRVKQLEEKVAELETLLKSGGDASATATSRNEGETSRRESTASNSQPPPLNHHSSSNSSQSQDVPMDQSGMGESSTSYGYTVSAENFDTNMFESILAAQNGGTGSTPNAGNSFASFGGAFFSGTTNTGTTPNFFASSPNSGQNIESLFDFNMLDPNYMSLLSSFGETSTGPSTSAQSTTDSSVPPPAPPTQPTNNITPDPPVSIPPQSSSASAIPHSHLDLPPPPPSSSTIQSFSASLGFFDPNSSNCPMHLNIDNPKIAPSPQTSQSNSKSNQHVNSCGPGDFTSQFLNTLNQNNPLTESEVRIAELIRSAQLQLPPGSDAESLLKDVEISMERTIGADRHTSLMSGLEDTHGRNENENSQQWVTGVTDSSTNQDPAGPGTTNGGLLSEVPFYSAGETNLGDTNDDGSTLVGGWFDAHDLPKIARDHLLDLFFSGMRLFGQEFHVPRFMASLTLPTHKRPHPCLLYSMYTLASRISDSPPIRQLEPHFYKIASSQLETSIGMADRLLDATRASTLLAIYKFSKARYHEGWMMTGQAARLALSCGLHQIPSSVYKPTNLPHLNADLVGMMRHRSYVLPPPKDAIELGERIWCFWSIYVTDRCGSISTQWPPAISDEVVTTPFPRPLHEYELGLVTEQDDHYSVQSIYKPSPHHNPLPHYAETTLISIRLRAICILERASKLMYQPPEEGWERSIPIFDPNPNTNANPSYSNSNSNSPSSNIDDYIYSQISTAAGFAPSYQRNGTHTSPNNTNGNNRTKEGWTRTARIRTPKAYEEVKQALLKIESDLPPEWRVEWWKWDGKVQEWHFTRARKDLITLHFVLGCAWMFLYDVFSFNAENTDAINVAKRLTVTVRFVSKEVMTSDLDVFIAMTWSFISKILIREMKRLQSLGDVSGANTLEPDIQVLVSALREFGQRYTIGTMQAMRTERYRQTTKEETSFLYRQDKRSQREADGRANANEVGDDDVDEERISFVSVRQAMNGDDWRASVGEADDDD